jgi:hypothetical protein
MLQKKIENMIPENADILIVKPFWANKLLSGEKTMEIRGQSCMNKLNTTIYLSKSGTQHVYGSLVFNDCVGPLTKEEFDSFHSMHCVSTDSSTTPYKKTYGWICEAPVIFERPIPYLHKKGAIVWLKYKSID